MTDISDLGELEARRLWKLHEAVRTMDSMSTKAREKQKETVLSKSREKKRER